MRIIMAVGSDQFFEHIDAFFDYGKNIYQVSDQTVKSNQVDLSLFQSFVQTGRYESIYLFSICNSASLL
jgi:hypothetical protein